MQTTEVLQAMLDGLSDGVYFTDRDRRITHWNKGAERLTGFTSEDVLGRCCRDRILVHVDENGRQLCNSGCPLAATLNDGQDRQAEAYLRHKDGHRLPVLVRVSSVTDEDGDGAISGAIEVFSDLSSRTAARQRIHDLENQAMFDDLTGLPNRRYLEGAVWEHLSGLAGGGAGFGTLFADIDNFKHVNDVHGHEAGDEVLRVVGRTLANSCRLSDVVGRWGGGEFLCLILTKDRNGLATAGERLCALIRESSPRHDGEPIPVSFSVGATMGRPDDDLDSLIRRADGLLYDAKESGKDRIAVDSD